MISFSNVFYSVPHGDDGWRAILDNVSFELPAKAISCIMGTSGSGKTTILRLMAGLIRPDAGEIRINEHLVSSMNERDLNEVRAEMGFVFQYSALFDSMTVGENVGFGLERQRRPREVIERTVARLLGDVGLSGIENKRPAQLSGGMKKRVAMARALATSPQFVLYDEPDSGLDPVMTRVIDDLIVGLRNTHGTTNVVVTHNVESIRRIADYVLMVHAGAIIAQGTFAEVAASPSPVVQQFLAGEAHGPILV